MLRYLAVLFLIVLAGLLMVKPGQVEIEGSFRLALDESSSPPAFAHVESPRSFTFPLDHGPHPEYQTEWWYYTGNLQTSAGEEFGYQLTIFRRALSERNGDRSAGLAAGQIYFAHFAITDASGMQVQQERFSRGAGGLAGATGKPYRVWLEDWEIRSINDSGSVVSVKAQHSGSGFDLELSSAKPVVLHGEDGLSAKSSAAGNASYYMSYTRMETEGLLTFSGEQYSVSGESWFDHEWGTSALSAQAVGWDWFGLQLDTGTELMLFQIRNADGTLDPVSGGTLIDPSGKAIRLELADIYIEAEDTWNSSDTGATYPSKWRIEIPEHEIELSVTPLISNQEMVLSIVYWEGAVRISGSIAGAQVRGSGYVELTGYAASMQGMF